MAAEKVYEFNLDIGFPLMARLSTIDRFSGSWENLERKFGSSLKELKSMATISSVGASTRIEGSKMEDEEVADLIEGTLKVGKLSDRDRQEVLGYFELLELISEAYDSMPETENGIRHMHKLLLKYSEKDNWHLGNYKQLSNAVVATDPLGRETVMFKTTEPALTPGAVSALIKWYVKARELPALVRIGIFVYEFLSIHPFQDGNGRLSRLITTLLMLQHGYSWIEYISFEQEIELRKKEYYKVLRSCQGHRPNENITPWIMFFLNCIESIQIKLTKKLELSLELRALSSKARQVYSYVEIHDGIGSSAISQKSGMALPTVKRILSELSKAGIIRKEGAGAGTVYTLVERAELMKPRTIKFTRSVKKVKMSFVHIHSYIEIDTIILRPLFPFDTADIWAKKMMESNLILRWKMSFGNYFQKDHLTLSGLNTPFLKLPEFEIKPGLLVAVKLLEKRPRLEDLPIHFEIWVEGSLTDFDMELKYTGV